MVHRVLLFAAALFSADSASVETPVVRPNGWRQGQRSNQEQIIEMTFAVKQQGKKELHDALMRVSKPNSPEYGQHLSNEEVQRMTAPLPEHVEAVMSLIRSHGGEPVAATPNSDMITAKMTVEAAERMLSAEYHQYHHSSGKEVCRVADGYSLPAAVAHAVDFVSPTVHFPGVHQPVKLEDDVNDTTRPLYNTPSVLRQLYNIDAEGKADGNKQAVSAFLGQKYNDEGLKEYWNQYCDGISCGKGEVKLVGDATIGHGMESMLDIETITGVSGNVESEFWGFAGRSPDNVENEPFMKWLAKMSSTSDDDIPKIFSQSYGEDESSWSIEAATRLNTEFQKAGVRGISLLYASGDSGANCKNGAFEPTGPATSPYVTSVGGTRPALDYPAPGGEAAIYLSGGGFSNYWGMPDWQKEAVAQYLTKAGLPDQSQLGYNTSGRAFPDISAQATHFIVIDRFNNSQGVSGTSCASPTAAGIFALLNDARMAAGQSSLGFLNPFIYEHASAFNDITLGSSGSGCRDLTGGWPAKEGWDAVTGVGTPDYAKLVSIVTTLPSGKGVGKSVLV